jgi:hypothetical protein
LGLTGVIFVLTYGMSLYNGVTPLIYLFGAVGVFSTFWGIYLRLDRRPFLDISADGIWCRSWGEQRLRFAEFKAVYPRRYQLNVGVVLVPQKLDELRAKLSWIGRMSLLGGTAVAHTGTLTLWTSRVDLPQLELLRAVQDEIVRASRGASTS